MSLERSFSKKDPVCWDRLPLPVLDQIMRFLSVHDVASVSMVCKGWHKAILRIKGQRKSTTEGALSKWCKQVGFVLQESVAFIIEPLWFFPPFLGMRISK